FSRDWSSDVCSSDLRGFHLAAERRAPQDEFLAAAAQAVRQVRVPRGKLLDLKLAREKLGNLLAQVGFEAFEIELLTFTDRTRAEVGRGLWRERGEVW